LGFLCCPIILDALERLKNVFIYAQTFWALWKNPKAQKMWGTLKILYGKIVKVENSCLLLPTILGALSHMKESKYIGKNNIRSSCDMKGFEI
jgi:hypothetical protein